MPPLETPGHSHACLAQSLVAPGVHKVLFVPFKSLFPHSCESFIIKSHWPPNSNSLGILILFASSKVGNLLWSLELLQQCRNFFGITVFQFVTLLPHDSMVGLMPTYSRRAYATCFASQTLKPEPLSLQQATAKPCLFRKHSNTPRQVWLNLLEITSPFSGCWYAQRLCLPPLSISGGYEV